MPQDNRVQSGPNRLRPTFNAVNPAKNKALSIRTSSHTGSTIGELKSNHT